MSRVGPDICGDCGTVSPRTVDGDPCRVCGGAPTPWVRVPLDFFDWVGRVVGATILGLSGAACWLAAGAFLAAWIGPTTGARVLQVLLGLIVVPGGAVVGWVLFQATLDTLRARTWRAGAEEGPQFAEAMVVGTRLDRGRGWVERRGEPWEFTEPTVSSCTAFGSFPTLRRTLLTSRTFARGTPGTVDLLVLMALVRMAEAGHIELTSNVCRSWGVGQVPPNPDALPFPFRRRRDPLLVRRGPRPLAGPDPIEALVLAGLSVTPAAPVADGNGGDAGPYRTPPAAPEPDDAAPPWVPLAEVLALGARTLPSPRRALRDQVREAMRRAGGDPLTEDDLAAASAAYAALFARQENNVTLEFRVFEACTEGLRPGAWREFVA